MIALLIMFEVYHAIKIIALLIRVLVGRVVFRYCVCMYVNLQRFHQLVFAHNGI